MSVCVFKNLLYGQIIIQAQFQVLPPPPLIYGQISIVKILIRWIRCFFLQLSFKIPCIGRQVLRIECYQQTDRMHYFQLAYESSTKKNGVPNCDPTHAYMEAGSDNCRTFYIFKIRMQSDKWKQTSNIGKVLWLGQQNKILSNYPNAQYHISLEPSSQGGDH